MKHRWVVNGEETCYWIRSGFSVAAVCFPLCSFEAPLAGMLTERRRTVRKQFEALQQRRALHDTTNHQHVNINLKDTPSPHPSTVTPVVVLPGRVCPTLHLDYTQKLQLQQQIQQVCKMAVSGMLDVPVVRTENSS